MSDATTDMILSRKEAGQAVREAEAERVRKEAMETPVSEGDLDMMEHMILSNCRYLIGNGAKYFCT